MSAHPARRAAGDILSVCRTASPGAAGRWLAALVTHLPECASHRSLSPADQSWSRSGASFRTPTGVAVSLPPGYTAGAREMYCRNVYLRAGLMMPSCGWVVDLGANRGLFSIWAALNGAHVVAIEAQHGFGADIQQLASHNAVTARVNVEIAVASGVATSGASVGVVADDRRWATASHGTANRPADVSIPQILAMYHIDRIGLLKVDIEGGEFAVLAAGEDLSWLRQVDQIALEIHRDHGDAAALIERIRGHGFTVDLRNNHGGQVYPASDHLDYAYGHRRGLRLCGRPHSPRHPRSRFSYRGSRPAS